MDGRRVICVFNFDHQPKDIDIKLSGSLAVFDIWTDEKIGFSAIRCRFGAWSRITPKYYIILGN